MPFIPLHLQFTIDKRPDLWYGRVCYLEPTRLHAAPLTPLDSALPLALGFCTTLVQITPLESTLTDTPPVTPLECALTKTPGRGIPQHVRLSRVQIPVSTLRDTLISGALTRLRLLPVR